MTRIDANGSTLQPQSNVSLLQSADQLAIQLGGDPQAYLAAMVLKFAGERRDDAEQARGAAETRIQQLENQQVRELREQADKIRMGGWIAGAGGVLGGAGMIAGGCSTREAGDALSKGEEALAKTNEGTAKIYEGYGKIGAALGDGGSQVTNGFAKDDEASSIAAANRASANIRRLDSLQDNVDSANDLEDAALDFLEQANKTKAETEQSLYIRG